MNALDTSSLIESSVRDAQSLYRNMSISDGDIAMFSKAIFHCPTESQGTLRSIVVEGPIDKPQEVYSEKLSHLFMNGHFKNFIGYLISIASAGDLDPTVGVTLALCLLRRIRQCFAVPLSNESGQVFYIVWCLGGEMGTKLSEESIRERVREHNSLSSIDLSEILRSLVRVGALRTTADSLFEIADTIELR